MRLALIGRDISHSRSPDLYRELIGPGISYELLDFESTDKLPQLADLATRLDGLSITSPYKEHFVSHVCISDPSVRALGAINTINLKPPYFATNTDLIAVRSLLGDFLKIHSDLSIVLLGNGVMARVTELVAKELGLAIHRRARGLGDDMQNLDLSFLKGQPLVINACSRSFVFQGKLPANTIFWDYNYNFLPHQNSLPSLVMTYLDGMSLLRLQAESAISFWSNNNP